MEEGNERRRFLSTVVSGVALVLAGCVTAGSRLAGTASGRLDISFTKKL